METPEESLNFQNQFQAVLIEFATRFINQPIEQTDDAIIKALRRIVELLGALQATIHEFSGDYHTYRSIYRWSPTQTIPPDVEPERLTPDKELLIPLLEKGEVLEVSNRENLPRTSELHLMLTMIGRGSVVVVPLHIEGQLFGFASASWIAPRKLQPEIIYLLRSVGEIFLNVIQRKKADEALRTLNITLEQQVQERTRELTEANRKLQQEVEERKQIEIALRESENRSRAILEALPIPVAVASMNSTLLYINKVAANLFGVDAITLETPITTEFFVNPEMASLLQQTWEKTQAIRDYEASYYIADGTIHTGLISVQPLQFAGQQAVLASFVDITELRQRQQTEEQHYTFTAALLDSAMAVMSTLVLDDVIERILQNVQRVVPHDVANVIILEGDQALVLGQRETTQSDMQYDPIRTNMCAKDLPYAQIMLETRRPVRVGYGADDPNFVRISQNPMIESAVGVPIMVGAEVIGFLNLGSQAAYFFTDTHLEYLQIFAMQAGIALQNARLYQHAQKIAILEERQRLTRELHDSVTQTLFSANSVAEALPTILQKKPEKLGGYLTELRQFTRGAMAEMRGLLVELRPEALIQTEFGVLITQLCDAFTCKAHIEVNRRINKKFVLPPDIQIAFYRIAQESLNNIAKYAEPTQVNLTVHYTPDSIEMSIQDHGIGFDVNAIPAGHFGLQIMRERAEEIEAALRIESEIGVGTKIYLRRALP